MMCFEAFGWVEFNKNSSKTKIKEGKSGISYLVAGRLILILFKG